MIDLQQAVVYDVETLPNCFTLNVVGLFTDLDMTFEISEYRDDRVALLAWFEHWKEHQTPMVGFNNLAFDYGVIHFIFYNPECSVAQIFEQAQALIRTSFGGRSFNIIWQSDRFAPQVDLFKIFHFDNPAKATSLKALQVSMRSELVLEMPLPWDQPIARDDVPRILIPYNKHDVSETKRFALMNLDAINFRVGLMETLRGDVMNFSDSKIGSKLLEQRLGDDLCYDRDMSTGRRVPRQTFRTSIALDEIIFPYIKFNNPEFNRVLSWMRTQKLTANDLTETIQTKGVFTGVHAHVGGVDFHFGTGGIHGSVSAQRLASDDHWVIRDIDVAGLYPAIAIVNRLYPEHLGERFVEEYAKLPKERKDWQQKKGKKCVEANSLKLAGNGTYGNSNNAYSVFYDPRFTMSITINGQLLLCMLAEWLLLVPTLQIIQINTDGVTYRVRRELVSYTQRVQKMWEDYTRLVLEEAEYSRMWIRDVNNYVAESTDGTLKQKGAYWFARKFPDDIANAQPPAWHKDFSAVVSVKAAVEHMVTGVAIEDFIYAHADPFDFMCRAKCDRSSKLMIGDQEVQRITRYFVSTNGDHMRKVSPPAKGYRVGQWKRAPKVSDSDYYAVLREVGDAWDARIHTKSKSKYEIRETSIESGYKVTDCSDARRFDFESVNYDYYIENAKKLVIA